MIVPMKHLLLLCVEADKKTALAKLAELDVMHVVTTVTDTGSILSARAGVEEAQRAKVVINLAVASKGGQLTLKPASFTEQSSHPLLRDVNDLADRYLETQDELRSVSLEIAHYAPWGDFDPTDAAKLMASGIPVTLFKAQLSDDVPSQTEGVFTVLGSDKNGVYGVVIGAELPEGLTAVPLPKVALSVVEKQRASLENELLEIARRLKAHKQDMPALEAELKRRMEVGEYVTVFENMPISGALSHIEGFIDARRSDEITAAAEANGWGVALRDPEADDNVPTLLEPPRLFRPVTALFKVLGITPGYNETDVSVPFFVFFSIFFSMLIGDAGYGTVILLLTAVAHFKAKAKAKGPLSSMARSLITLFYVFGSGTVTYGVLTGTYFGMPQSVVPACLQFKSIPFLADMNNIMQLCFTLGAVHLSIARLWNAAVLFPSKKFLAEIGWTGVIWSMYMIICSIVVEGFVFPAWGSYMLGISILLIVLFMLDISELKENGATLGMLPLSIVSSMGDIISYVRLFAVGLAGVKVAENFNSMALDLDLPMYVKLPAMILILLLGHSLNFVMGALSILVHAVRLNTLEFSGAKGVTWCGHPFKPFKASSREESTAAVE